ncbi:MAG: hypothetical protein R8K54_02430 [Mariprofundaceae bacterium]
MHSFIALRLVITLLSILGFSAPCFSGTTLAGGDSYYIGARAGADVFESPNKRANVTTHLTRKTSVKILQKRRGWRKIETEDEAKVTGWVFEGAVRKRYQSAKSSKKSSFLSSFTSFFLRSPEPTHKTAVLGVRGLEDNSVASTKREATEHANTMVQWMDTLNVGDDAVNAFVEEGDLNP